MRKLHHVNVASVVEDDTIGGKESGEENVEENDIEIGFRSKFKSSKRKRKNVPLRSLGNSDSEAPLYTQESVMIQNEVASTSEIMESGIYRTKQQFSETPSFKGLKRLKLLLENAQILNLSLHQVSKLSGFLFFMTISRFFQLARDGDLQHVRQVLDACCSDETMKKRINQYDEDKLTPLHYAARYSHFPIVKILVERGAEVNISGETKITPLHFAARYRRTHVTSTSGYTASGKRKILRQHSLVNLSLDNEENIETESIVTYLVARGADPNASDMYGLTPLHFAAMRENAIVAQELMKCNSIQCDAQDHQLMTPLHAACTYGSVECAKLLLEKGADILATDEAMKTPLHLAAQNGHANIIELLLEFSQEYGSPGEKDLITMMKMLQAEDYEGNTPLMLAVDNGNYETASLLLEKGADANTYRLIYNTALHVACVAGDLRIVKLLVEHGARIDARNMDHATPLHKTCSFSHVEILEYLINNGAQIEARDNYGFTPLLIASCEEHPGVVISLINHGVNVAAANKLDKTCIYMAAEYNNLNTLQVLLQCCEELGLTDLVNKGNRYMNTPLHIACKNGYLEVTQCLLDAGAKIDAQNEEEKAAIHLAAEKGRTAIVRALVRRSKVMVANEDEESNTPLHIAASKGHEMVCQELLESGADIAARNAFLWTPLDCAAAGGWEKTTKLLLDYDAPVDSVDKVRTTPLHLASREGHVEVVRLLLEQGASLSLLDHRGYNCLDHAIEQKHREVASVIVKDKRWQDALRNSREVEDQAGAEFRVTPLRLLIKSVPEVAKEVFDKCTIADGHPESLNYSVTFDYEFLEDTYCDWLQHGTGSSDSLSFSYTSSKQPSVIGYSVKFQMTLRWSPSMTVCCSESFTMCIVYNSNISIAIKRHSRVLLHYEGLRTTRHHAL